jgi:hypothetical protein
MSVPFQDYAQEVKPALEGAYTRHLQNLLGETLSVRTTGATHSLTGGKKIRGTLLCLLTAALGGTLDDALPRAVAVELIQTATLIHDDFVDQHRSRRGLPAVWTLEGARRAVLLGDVVFSSAIRMMSELGREEGLILSQTIAEVARGACREPLDAVSLLELIEGREEWDAGYEKIISLKTGVLFAAACHLGALAAGVGADGQQAWRRYGQKIGEAYQIADDLQDLSLALRKGFVTVEEATDLAPSLSYFARPDRSCICRMLGCGKTSIEGKLRGYFEAAAVSMRQKREGCLRAAVEATSGHLPAGPHASSVQRAPWDLIRMFDGVCAR